ncbi:MAG TPA: diguanylate cyclase [Cyanobacteria bacterium UBA8553]|nr:diguanylate cyclase [Cyanobacteria bacterium UBA8553]HAJ62503.1 diguanylate cyclase [Cyanobacteria bacterium UBA8543]
MSDREKSQEQLIEELESLRREVAELTTTKTAFDAQNELLRGLITMLQTATGKLMLRAMLQQILNVSRGLTNAEEGSLFLLDDRGTVTESILARGATIRGQKQRLVGEVLQKGLAGWVIHHRQVGLITDTMQDERWLTLPSQPYEARSALCIPILQGKELLGIITLMHSQPGHFNPVTVQLMQMTADQIALILDNARLHTELQESTLHKTAQQLDQELSQAQEQLSNREEFSLIGIYIIFGEGNFLYANPRVAEIFGYTFGELVSLESVLDLIGAEHRNFVSEQLNQCLQGHSKNLSCKFLGQRKDTSLIDVEIYGTRTKLYGKFVIIGAVRVI